MARRWPYVGIARIRTDFPILHQEVNGHPLVYLDNAATTQKPRQVIDAHVRYYETNNANIHRGIHTLAQRATEEYEGTRAKVARFIGARDRRDTVFTRNATEAINLVAHAWGDHFVGEGDEIVLTIMEHHSNIVPWQLLAQRKGAHISLFHYPLPPLKEENKGGQQQQKQHKQGKQKPSLTG